MPYLHITILAGLTVLDADGDSLGLGLWLAFVSTSPSSTLSLSARVCPSVQLYINCAVLNLKCAVPTAHCNEIDHLITTTNYLLVLLVANIRYF